MDFSVGIRAAVAPAVADAAVIAIPDEDAGEIPKAFVVLKSPATADELMAHVAGRLAVQEGRRVEFVDQIPKSPSGKILRRVRRDREKTIHREAVKQVFSYLTVALRIDVQLRTTVAAAVSSTRTRIRKR
jgi:hypothetical protein